MGIMAKIRGPKTITGQSRDAAGVKGGWMWTLREFYEDNKRLVTWLGVGAAVIVAGIFGFNYIQGAQSKSADEALGSILKHYEAAEYRIALEGTGETLGLLDVIDRYDGTAAGNLARFYAGDALFRLADYEGALEHFEQFDADNDIVGASVVAGRAAIYEMNGEFERAGELFERAAGLQYNLVHGPRYLMSSARAYMQVAAYDRARDVLEELQEEYPDSDLADEVTYQLGFVSARLN